MISQPSAWKSGLVKKGVVPNSFSETTPFVFNDRLYRLENFMKSQEFLGKPVQYRFHEDGFRIRDVELDRVISVPLLNHYFAIAYVWEGRVYAFAGFLGTDDEWWRIRRLVMISSDDLITWTAPKVVLEAENNEHIFNTGICHDGKRFVLLYETDDQRYTPKFTFKYSQSDDLAHWERIPGALYGLGKYVGGPALYFENGWYYTLYLEALEGPHYETRLTRSRDLIEWHDAPPDRPFVTYDSSHRPDPGHHPEVFEINASDAELCEFRGKTIVYFNGGNQQGVGDLQWAEYDGSPRDLLESFYADEGPA